MEGRRWGGGARGKVEVLYELLATQPWQSMPLQLRYADEYGWGWHEMVMKRSERESKDWEKVQGKLLEEEEQKVERMKRHIYALPAHMPLTVGPFDQLDMYAYRRLRRERRKGRMEAGEGMASVTPGEGGESEMDDGLLDDEGMVSGEESHNSGESDVEIIEKTDNDELAADSDDDWTSYPLTQTAAPRSATITLPASTSSSSSFSRLPSSSPGSSVVSTQLRCGLCFRRSETGEGGHGGFFSGCDQCRFVGHLTCIVQHIFKQMPSPSTTARAHDADLALTQPTAAQPSTTASTLSPPTRVASNPADLFSPSPAFPPTIFSSLSPSLPLLPPPSTGSCPTCNARLSYPLLIERCRYMHQGKDGRRGGDVWYDEADELSISAMVREYAGRAGELKAKEKEERAERKKAEGTKKRKSRAKSTTAADGGDESSSTDSSVPSPRQKRKQTTSTKRAKTAAVSPSAVSRSRSPPPSSLPLPSKSERNKENAGGVVERKTDEPIEKRKPTASRRVAMQDKAAAAPLFASSQPAAGVASSVSTVPVSARVSLSDDDEVLLVDELSSADKRRQLMAEAAERRLGKSPTNNSQSSAHHAAASAGDVSMLAVKGSGGLHAAEPSTDVAASRDYVRLDDDSDDVLALDTEPEDEVSGMSLSERLKARAESAQLAASLQDI